MTKIKVLHCITDLSPDGAQRTLLRLMGSLDPSRFESRVVCLRAGGSLAAAFQSAGFSALELGMYRGIPSVGGLMRLRSIVREWRPHLVQGWMYHGNIAALMAARMSGLSVPVLWNVRRCLYDISRDRVLTRWTIRTGARLSRWVNRIIYCVELAALQHEALGFEPSRRIVIPNGFDTLRFKPMERRRAALRRELGVSDDALLVGAVGRYHPQKDFEGFLRGAAFAVWGGIDAHFVLVGRGVSPDNRKLVSLASELGISSRIHLLGERQDIPTIMSGLDLFVSSSDNEGFSNVLGEAMACGIPCVATDVGAAREVLLGVGRLVPSGEPFALGAAISEMLSLSGERRAAIGVRGRMRIEERYSFERMVDRYATLYSGMIERSGISRTDEVYRAAA
jgi:glycosyltransferase involved in cell wall biosynthesis